MSLRVGEKNAQPGEVVCLPVGAAGLENLANLEFTLAWDTAVVQWEGVEDIGLSGLDDADFSGEALGPGTLSFRWRAEDGQEVRSSDLIPLFTACFRVHGPEGSNSPVIITDTAIPIEIRDADGNRQDPSLLQGSIVVR